MRCQIKTTTFKNTLNFTAMTLSIDTMLDNAGKNVKLYANTDIEINERDNEFFNIEDVTIDEKLAFYNKRDELQAIKKKAIRDAYKGLVQVAGLFGNEVDPKIKNNITKIADELGYYRGMVTFMFRQATKVEYKVNSIWATE